MRTRHTIVSRIPLVPSFKYNDSVKRRILQLLMLVNTTLPITRLMPVYLQLKHLVKHIYIPESPEENTLLVKLCKVIRNAIQEDTIPNTHEGFIEMLKEMRSHDAWKELMNGMWVNVVTIHDYRALGIIKKLIDLEIYSGTNIKYRAKLGTDRNLTTYICNKGYLRDMAGNVVYKTTANDRALRRDEEYQLQLLRMNSFRPATIPEDRALMYIRPHEWVNTLTRGVLETLDWKDKEHIVNILDKDPTIWRAILKREPIPVSSDRYRNILKRLILSILEFGKAVRMDKYGKLTRVNPYKSLYEEVSYIKKTDVPEDFNIVITYVESRPRVLFVPAKRYIPAFDKLDVVMRRYTITGDKGSSFTWVRYKDGYRDLQMIKGRDHVITNLSRQKYYLDE